MQATAPGLVHGIHDPAWRPEPERADPEAKRQYRARHCGRRRGGYLEPSPELHLPLAHGIPGSDKELMAIADGKRPGELVIPGREITRRCANLAVGQLGASQPVTLFDRQPGEAHCLIMPHETSPAGPIA